MIWLTFMGKSIFVFTALVLLFSCKKKEQQASFNQADQEHSENGHAKQVDLQQFAKDSEMKIDMMWNSGDTLDIASSGDLSYRPFGVLPFRDSLQLRFNGIFSVMETPYDGRGRMYQLSFQNSTIKIIEVDSSVIPHNADKLTEYRHTKPPLAVIHTADIKDNGIALIDEIEIGMSKEDFFYRVFRKRGLFKDINTVINGDTPGELISQYFVFTNDTLTSIRFSRP